MSILRRKSIYPLHPKLKSLNEIIEYIETEWGDTLIPDVPGCARQVLYMQEHYPEFNIDNVICYWFRKA